MLTRNEFLSLNFVKKEDYTGSYKGMRFMLHQATVDEEKKLQAYVWPEPYGFEATEDEKKLSEYFSFSEQGLEEAIVWMNERYEMVKYTE